jgi:hypothetical protein
MPNGEEVVEASYRRLADEEASPPAAGIHEPVHRSRIKTLACVTAAVIAFDIALAGINYVADKSEKITLLEQKLTAAEQKSSTTNQRLRRVADQFAQLLDVRTNTVLGKDLTHVSELAGHDKKAGAAQTERLKASAVALLTRKKGSRDKWMLWCSGAKVAYGKADYVMTAAHCLNYHVYVPDSNPKTENVYNADTYEYAVVRPTASTKDKAYRLPLGLVTAESVTLDHNLPSTGTDVALLKVSPLPVPKGMAGYGAMPAMELNHQQKPHKGEEVTWYSLPSAVGRLGVQATGTYLSSLTHRDKHGYFAQRYNLIGLKARDARKDPFEHGGSGSFGISASGYVFGPLSSRLASPHEAHQSDAPTTTFDDLRDSLWSRLRLEQRIKIDLSAYKVVGYASSTSNYLVKALVKGFDTPGIPWHKRPPSIR